MVCSVCGSPLQYLDTSQLKIGNTTHQVQVFCCPQCKHIQLSLQQSHSAPVADMKLIEQKEAKIAALEMQIASLQKVFNNSATNASQRQQAQNSLQQAQQQLATLQSELDDLLLLL